MDKVLAIGENVLSIGGMLLKPIEREPSSGNYISWDSGICTMVYWDEVEEVTSGGGWTSAARFTESPYTGNLDYQALPSKYPPTYHKMNGILFFETKIPNDATTYTTPSTIVVKIPEPELTMCPRMFWYCTNLVDLDISQFNTSNVWSMREMFSHCYSLEEVNLSSLDTAKVKYMQMMFDYCTSLKSIDLTSLDLSSVKDMESMFRNCTLLESANFPSTLAPNLTKMSGMFSECQNLKSVNLSNFIAPNLKYVTSMFSNCNNLTSVDLSNFDIRSVTDTVDMFNGCSSLTELDLSSFVTSKVTDVSNMFSNCTRLEKLDISHFDFSKLPASGYPILFNGCSNLKYVYVTYCSSNTISKLQTCLRNGTARTYNLVTTTGKKTLVRQ